MGGSCSTKFFPVGDAFYYCKCCGCFCACCQGDSPDDPLLANKTPAIETPVVTHEQTTQTEKAADNGNKEDSFEHSIYESPQAIHGKSITHWGYDEHNGPTCWGDLDHKNIAAIKGKQQSPINIISDVNNTATRRTITESQNITFEYPEFCNKCTIVNNGHTVQVNVYDGGTLTLSRKQYTLKQFHFHTPSEHTVDAKPFDMELHLVHVNDDDGSIAVLGFFFRQSAEAFRPIARTLSDARNQLLNHTDENFSHDEEPPIDSNPSDDVDLSADSDFDNEKDPPAMAAMATESDKEKEIEAVKNRVKFGSDTDDEKGDESDDGRGGRGKTKRRDSIKVENNEFLSQFWDQLPKVTNTKNPIKLAKAVTFDYLFEGSSYNYIKENDAGGTITAHMNIFHYEGSLTTPPCTEGVKWLVCTKPQLASTKQLHEIKGCWNYVLNARPVQGYNGRVVTMCSKVTFKTH